MNSNVISTETLEKMANIFSKAGYLKQIKEESHEPKMSEFGRDSYKKEFKKFEEELKQFKENDGTCFSFVDKKVKEILS